MSETFCEELLKTPYCPLCKNEMIFIDKAEVAAATELLGQRGHCQLQGKLEIQCNNENCLKFKVVTTVLRVARGVAFMGSRSRI